MMPSDRAERAIPPRKRIEPTGRRRATKRTRPRRSPPLTATARPADDLGERRPGRWAASTVPRRHDPAEPPRTPGGEGVEGDRVTSPSRWPTASVRVGEVLFAGAAYRSRASLGPTGARRMRGRTDAPDDRRRGDRSTRGFGIGGSYDTPVLPQSAVPRPSPADRRGPIRRAEISRSGAELTYGETRDTYRGDLGPG